VETREGEGSEFISAVTKLSSMKNYIFHVFFLFLLHISHAQEISIDSLKSVIKQHKEDTTEVNTLVILANSSQFPDAISYGNQGLRLAQKINYKKGEANCNLVLASSYSQNGSSIQAIQYALNALDIYEDLNDYTGIASVHLILQGNYREVEDYNRALIHEFQGEQVAEANNVKGVFIFSGHRLAPLFLAEIGQTYVLKNQLDSALIYVQKSIEQNELFNGSTWYFPIYLLATIQQMRENYVSSLENSRIAKHLAIMNRHLIDTLQIYSGMSTLFKKIGQSDSSVYYAQIVAKSWNKNSEIKNLLEAVTNLADIYKLKNKDSAIKYIELSHVLKDSLLSTKNDREIQGVSFNAQLKQEKQATEQAKYKNRIQLYATIAGLFVLLLITAILWKNYKQQQKAKSKIEHAYSELKSTQAQLIQSEKMASLGELTAGIAHEIQNPLNFVNNFSEVNTELIDELKEEANKGNINEIKIIADDIKDNEQKILHHGKRADAIVKGMLQHSRASTGKKEPTDINALADEYLRLSYQGMRAKDKNFNAEIKTDFDESIEKIKVVPQDIGRVLLNLFNNAFYALSAKALATSGSNYHATISVCTKKVDSKVEIHVSDNGIGIPQKVVDKIFQPFFTTKPTGQGTGLGLSLSYDIVKAHNGEIKVETKEGESAEFIIYLPCKLER